MGVFADFLAHSSLLKSSAPEGRAYNDLVEAKNEIDPVVSTGFDAQDEVQVVVAFSGTIDSGNYTLTLTPPVEDPVTTANIAYNANAATIEGAIDTACTGNISSWTNGDISVSGGPLTGANVVLTFDGDSVTEKNYSVSAIANVDLHTTGNTANGVITTTNGTLTFTSDEVGDVYNDLVFTLSDAGTLDVSYDDVNTFTLNYSSGIEATANITTDGGTLDFQADDVGVASNNIVFVLDNTGTLNVNYDDVNTYTLAYDPGVAATANVSCNNGDLTFEADEVGTASNNVVFFMVSGANTAVTYNAANTTYSLEYIDDTTTFNDMELAFDSAEDANPTWPQFECSQTANDAVLINADDAATDTSANGANATTLSEMETEFNNRVDGNGTWPQFLGAQTGNGAFIIAVDDTLTDTSAGGVDTTTHTAMQSTANDAMTANVDWPQFECTQTGNSAAIEAGDDGANTTTANGVDAGSLGAVSTTTKGQQKRYAWSVMYELGLFETPPDQGDTLADDATLWTNPGDNPKYPSAAVRKVLAWQAAIDDDNETLRTQLETLFHIK